MVPGRRARRQYKTLPSRGDSDEDTAGSAGDPYSGLNTASVLPTRMMSPGSRVFFGTL
jgi:hypothetical protein